MNHINSALQLNRDILNSHRERINECHNKIDNLEKNLIIYIDERLRKMDKRFDETIGKLKKLESLYPTY